MRKKIFFRFFFEMERKTGKRGVLFWHFWRIFFNNVSWPSDHRNYTRYWFLSEDEHWGRQLYNLGLIILRIFGVKKIFRGGVLFWHIPDDIKNVTESMFLSFFKISKNEIHVFIVFWSLQKIKTMFFHLFCLLKRLNESFLAFEKSHKIESMFFDLFKLVKNYLNILWVFWSLQKIKSIFLKLVKKSNSCFWAFISLQKINSCFLSFYKLAKN